MARGNAESVDRCAGTWAPLALAAASALALSFALGGERRLEAGGGLADDGDGDFLVDAQEKVLGTSRFHADSDADGYSDLEELARNTSPISWHEAPAPGRPTTVGMTAHGGLDGKIHILAAVYTTDMSLAETSVRFGFQTERRVAPLRNDWVAQNSNSFVTTAAGGHALLALIDLRVDPAAIHNQGRVSIFATTSIVGSGVVQAAAFVHLLSIDGTVVLAMPSPRTDVMLTSGLVQSPGATLYVPLPVGGGSVPASWSAGEICFQRSMPVAVNGAVLTQEVVSADCLNGWDGYCPPSCTSTVGSTYATVDVIGLIGG